MKPEIRAKYKSEMAFFKNIQTVYNTALDDCGDIAKSLAGLKKNLNQSRDKLSPDKWMRLHSALRTGEITRGKRSTPGDWATNEIKILRASRALQK
jgi:hypothetical protein